MSNPNFELPTKEQVSRRAYELYLERADKEGSALQDWLTAEKQLYDDYLLEKFSFAHQSTRAVTAALGYSDVFQPSQASTPPAKRSDSVDKGKMQKNQS